MFSTSWRYVVWFLRYYFFLQRQFSENLRIFQPVKFLKHSKWTAIDLDAQLNYIKIKSIQKLLNASNALWKDLMLYWLKLILNSNQGLSLFRQKQIFTGLLVTKIYKSRKITTSLRPHLLKNFLTNPFF